MEALRSLHVDGPIATFAVRSCKSFRMRALMSAHPAECSYDLANGSRCGRRSKEHQLAAGQAHSFRSPAYWQLNVQSKVLCSVRPHQPGIQPLICRLQDSVVPCSPRDITWKICKQVDVL